MKLKFFGTGTSQGIPVIGSTHPVCLSKDLKDKRLRSSVLITTDENKKILIDCGPDFRIQMLNNNENNIDAVLLTHEHNDHVAGLDDLRPIIFRNKKDMPIFAQKRVLNEIKNRFSYAFDNPYPGIPKFELRPIEKEFELEKITIKPLEILHGNLEILGYKIGKLAYITDAKYLPEKTLEQLKDLDTLIINCLRKENEHHSHYILSEIIELQKILLPKKTYLTHISHHLGFHEETNHKLINEIELAYDGLEINFE